MKKRIIINTIFIFILCIGIHFLYNFIPCFLTSLIAPVNESIWEHLKMLFVSCIIYTLISNIFYKDKNVFLIGYLKSMLSIIILLILYLPSRAIFGEIMPLTIAILFISILITEIIINKCIDKEYNKLNIISIFLIIIDFIIFAYFTYNPIKTDLFYDTHNDKYGIDIIKNST